MVLRAGMAEDGCLTIIEVRPDQVPIRRPRIADESELGRTGEQRLILINLGASPTPSVQTAAQKTLSELEVRLREDDVHAVEARMLLPRIKSIHEAVAAALESIAAVNDESLLGVIYAADWKASMTPKDVPAPTTHSGARRVRRAARRIKDAFAAGVTDHTKYIGIVGRVKKPGNSGMRVRRREHERAGEAYASMHGAGFRRYGVSKRIRLRAVGRWALRPRGLLAEFVLVLMPGIEDGRPVRTESAPFLLNAEPGGGMGHRRSQPSDEWGRNPSDLFDDDGMSDKEEEDFEDDDEEEDMESEESDEEEDMESEENDEEEDMESEESNKESKESEESEEAAAAGEDEDDVESEEHESEEEENVEEESAHAAAIAPVTTSETWNFPYTICPKSGKNKQICRCGAPGCGASYCKKTKRLKAECDCGAEGCGASLCKVTNKKKSQCNCGAEGCGASLCKVTNKKKSQCRCGAEGCGVSLCKVTNKQKSLCNCGAEGCGTSLCKVTNKRKSRCNCGAEGCGGSLDADGKLKR